MYNIIEIVTSKLILEKKELESLLEYQINNPCSDWTNRIVDTLKQISLIDLSIQNWVNFSGDMAKKGENESN